MEPSSATRARVYARSANSTSYSSSEKSVRAIRAEIYALPLERDATEIMTALASAYSRVTGSKNVTPKQRRLLLVAHRYQRERTTDLLRKLHAEGGTTDLLARLRDYQDAEPAELQAQPAEASPKTPAPVPDGSPVTFTLDEVEDILAEATYVNGAPEPEPATVASPNTVHVECREYTAHRNDHVRDGTEFVCLVCNPRGDPRPLPHAREAVHG